MDTSREMAQNVAAAINTTNGTVKMDNAVIELWDKATSSLITFKGRNAADAADANVNAYALNVDALNTSDGYVPIYNDGFTGKLINKHLAVSNAGRGKKVKEITFIATTIATGAQNSAALQALDFQIVGYRVKGGSLMTVPIDLGAAIRNTQFQSGTLTLVFPEGVWLNAATQLKAYIQSGCQVTANLIYA